MDQSDPPVWQSEHLVVLADHADRLLRHLKDYWSVGESSPPAGQPFHDEVITLIGCVTRLPVDLLRLPEPTRMGVRIEGFAEGVGDEVVGAVERIRIIAGELQNAIESEQDTETGIVTGPNVAEFHADEDVLRRLEFAAGKLRESISAATSTQVSTEQEPHQNLLDDVAKLIATEAEKVSDANRNGTGNRKPKVSVKKRGKSADGTTKVDLAVRYIIDNPSFFDISSADLAKIVGCTPSLLSNPDAKSRLSEARATAKRNTGSIRRGFVDASHQADAPVEDNWKEIDKRLDGD